MFTCLKGSRDTVRGVSRPTHSTAELSLTDEQNSINMNSNIAYLLFAGVP